MNKTTRHLERPQPSQVRRADLAPATGYAMLVDGPFKTEFLDQDAATQAALELLAKYPMLKIEIYDAASKSRGPRNSRCVAACVITMSSVLIYL
ncbi:hypothetical protein [Bradyrhizobium sp. 87]|jgi:hypothetical protein|uniref:hypothetical protein n=1 Tax=Bradyrhizobium sp. 87 TaxID=2782682 RepID=UPI001FFB3C86|nr:hypothetical protein [Bradyrhizobium sp. 87]MCK1427183.1 hypothetical protein [Bradyrhizobium sp. 87]